ncbi:hypothetical protein ABVT39_015580 [Epinephelus coioides]
MGPLTSPSGCVSCARLANKIVELEGLVEATEATSAPADVTSAHSPAADAPSVTVLDDSWTRLGGLKPWSAPLLPITSLGLWSVLAVGEGGAPLMHLAPRCNIQLENKFDILHEFCPVDAESKPPPSSPLMPRGSHSSPMHQSPPLAVPDSSSCCRSTPFLTPAPQRSPVLTSPSTHSFPAHLSPPTSPPPSLAVRSAAGQHSKHPEMTPSTVDTTGPPPPAHSSLPPR